jgi:polysaccharide biosynthesis transport protein
MRNTLRDLQQLVGHRRWLIIGFILLGLSLGLLLAWSKEDVYRSETVLLVDPPEVPPQRRTAFVLKTMVEEQVASATSQVMSRRNLQTLIEEFQLYPESVKAKGYETVIDRLRNHIRIHVEENGGIIEAISLSFAYPDAVIAGRVTNKLAEGFLHITAQAHAAGREPYAALVDQLSQERSRLKGELDQKEQELAAYRAQNANGLLGHLAENLQTRDRLQSDFMQLTQRRQILQARLDQVEHNLQERQATLSSEQFASQQEQGRLVSRLTDMRSEWARKSEVYPPGHPEILALTMQIDMIEQDLNALLETGNSSLSAERLQNIAELKKNRQDLIQEMNGLTGQLEGLTRNLQTFERRIEQTPLRQEGLQKLEREYAELRAGYERLTQRLLDGEMAERQAHRVHTVTFSLLDAARLHTASEGLSPAGMALGGLGMGLVLGVGIAYLLDQLFPTFRRPEDAEVALGLQTLATIPSFHTAYGKSMKLLAGATDSHHLLHGTVEDPAHAEAGYPDGNSRHGYGPAGASSRPHAFPPQLNLVTKWRPQSIVAEQYRVAATRLEQLGEGEEQTIVLVTSSKKGEGKTCTSSNLAYTLARDLDEPTLVIDCDFKCPNLHNVLVLPPGPGVAEFLAGREPLEACMRQVPEVPLWCMTAGNLRQHPISLAKMQKLTSILSAVKARYRYIILDGPPILPLADTHVLCGLATVVLMVVRFGSTPRDVVEKAVDMIQHRSHVRLVLTDAGAPTLPQYEPWRQVRIPQSASVSLPGSHAPLLSGERSSH